MFIAADNKFNHLLRIGINPLSHHYLYSHMSVTTSYLYLHFNHTNNPLHLIPDIHLYTFGKIPLYVHFIVTTTRISHLLHSFSPHVHSHVIGKSWSLCTEVDLFQLSQKAWCSIFRGWLPYGPNKEYSHYNISNYK